MKVAIIGAGPAGLTAATLLSQRGVSTTVLESDPDYVGGISRTVKYKGFHFDVGGHRFFSKSQQVEDFWTDMLGDDMLQRSRSSRIFYQGKYFSYPLKAIEALVKLGFIESVLCVLSYLKARLFPTPNPRSVEDWVSNQFGKRLYNIFFKTYTEKVWGMSCRKISADWAAQRIKGLSLATTILHALTARFKPKNRTKVIKTLIDTFRYPRKGPGMMWEACARKVKDLGGDVLLDRRVNRLEYNPQDKKWVVYTKSSLEQTENLFIADHVISSAPLRELVNALSPKVSDRALRAANALKYRDFLTVALISRGPELFPDNWIYLHDPSVKAGRIQNYKSWSPEMVPDPNSGCYGLEYFAFEGDDLWALGDEELKDLAKREIEKIFMNQTFEITDACVVRQRKAYPVYDEHYQNNIRIIREELEEKFPSLHLVGRNGMHKYNNQDHAMMTSMLTVENIIAGKRVYDVWKVNQDAEYHEEPAGGSNKK